MHIKEKSPNKSDNNFNDPLQGWVYEGQMHDLVFGGGGHKLYKRANQKTNEAVIFLPQIDPELMKSAHDDEECIDSSIP